MNARIISYLVLPVAIAVSCIFTTPAVADDQNKLLNMCRACHGAAGASDYPNIPNLRWQNEAYLVKQLQAFQSGARQDKTMTPVASLLSEEDIQQMAHYFYLGQEQ